MTTTVSLASRIAGLLVVGLTVATAAGCTPRPDGPAPVAERFFGALAAGDTAAAADLSDDPATAREALNAAWAGLQASGVEGRILGSKYTEDTGGVAYRYTWQLPKGRTWTYDGQLKMIRNEGNWQIRWDATGLHPKLGERQTFALRSDLPRRASVHEAGGSDVLVPGFVYRYQLDATEAGRGLMHTARAVVEALYPFDDTLNNPQRLAEEASSSTRPLDLITLRNDDHNRVVPVLGGLPGVTITPQEALLPTDDQFAPAVINEVKAQVADELDGEAGWRVVSVNQNGVDVAVLDEAAPSPAPAVTVSLDRAVQNAAQHAVDTRGAKAMMVVLKPSTGEILGLAQNAPTDVDGPVTTTGLFPPGSTFKVVTAGAALERNMTNPNAMVGCPGKLDIGERTVPNYGGFDLGVVPMARAFADSCNTTFAELASRMPPKALTQTAAQYGLGLDYQVDGLTTVTGTVPPTVNLTERTEDGFGQGRVLVSPLGAALMAATVAAGKTPVPQLIEGRTTTVSGEAAPISAEILNGLRSMMRLVVTDGSGRDIADCGEVYGKTGEAEFDGGSHSWFTGYRGDMAFASLIVGGGSSEFAVKMTKVMLDSLPGDFLA